MITIEERKKFKKMSVSRNENYWVERIVLFESSCGGAVAVDPVSEEEFLNGSSFHMSHYKYCKPIPEPSTEIWSWQKAVVWCNKQENIVTYLDGLRGVSSGFGPRSLCDMEDVIWNKLNDDGTYKYDKWRKFNDRDCLDE